MMRPRSAFRFEPVQKCYRVTQPTPAIDRENDQYQRSDPVGRPDKACIAAHQKVIPDSLCHNCRSINWPLPRQLPGRWQALLASGDG